MNQQIRWVESGENIPNIENGNEEGKVLLVAYYFHWPAGENRG